MRFDSGVSENVLRPSHSLIVSIWVYIIWRLVRAPLIKILLHKEYTKNKREREKNNDQRVGFCYQSVLKNTYIHRQLTLFTIFSLCLSRDRPFMCSSLLLETLFAFHSNWWVLVLYLLFFLQFYVILTIVQLDLFHGLRFSLSPSLLLLVSVSYACTSKWIKYT